MSLAAHALNSEGAVCRPQLVPPSTTGGPPIFEAKGLRHPSGVCVWEEGIGERSMCGWVCCGLWVTVWFDKLECVGVLCYRPTGKLKTP